MQSYHMPRPRIHATAVNIQHASHGIAKTVAYALVSGIIVLWMAYLSSVTSSILSRLKIVTYNNAVFSSTAKGDRLAGATFVDRWSALGRIDAMRPSVTVPYSCQPDTPCSAKPSVLTRLAVAE
jgi:hypothetical protein